jgi:DNA-binding transcriptional MocR family regulator
MMDVLASAKDGSDIDTSTFAQGLVSEYLASGRFGVHLETVRAAYRLRRDTMIAALERHFPAGTRWSVPRHGALVWVELPGEVDTTALLRVALEAEGVAYVPGSAFAVDGGRAGASAMRLNFSHPTVAQIEEGIARLGRVVREAVG